MRLTNSLYQYLVTIRVYEPKHKSHSSSIELSETQQVLIENGVVAAKLLKSIYLQKSKMANRPLTPMPQLDQLKQVTTASTKLYNWNIVIESMRQLQIPNEIDRDIKQLILNGDVQILEETIHNIFTHLTTLLTTKPRMKSSEIRHRSTSGHLNQPQQIAMPNQNTLEFFTHSLSKWLNLVVKQVISLYADNFKYLAQVFTKGIQRMFEPIIGFYGDMFEQMDHLLNLISMEQDKALKFSLSLLKPGLVSKSQEVAVAAIKALGKLAIIAYNNRVSYSNEIYKWYTQSCLQTTLLSIRRHPALVDSLVDLLFIYCQNNLVDLFSSTLQKHCSNTTEFLITLDKIFSALNEEIMREINSMGMLQQWMDLCFQQDETTLKPDERVAILRLSCTMWVKFYNQFDQYQDKFHYALKSAALDTNQVVSLFGILTLFQLVEQFGNNKVKEAPIIYKIIALVLVETQSETITSFILMNLLHLFQIIPSIPLSVVLDPLVALLQEQSYPTLTVFHFLQQVSKDTSLTIKSQVQLMDLLSKITIYDTIHYQIAIDILMRLVTNTINELSTQEFIIKFSKVALAVYFAVHKKKDHHKKPQQQSIEKQRSAQIIEVLKQLIQIGNQNINDMLQMLIGHTNLQFHILNHKYNNGLNYLLSLTGEVPEIMKQVHIDHEQQKIQHQVYSESSVFEVKEVQSNLKKYSKIKLTKEEQYHLARLRMPKQADPKVVEDIQSIKHQFKEKQLNKQTMIKEKEEQLVVQRQQLRKQLEKRQIEQGIASLNKRDVEVRLLYPFGECNILSQNKHGLPVFELVDMQLEEDIDQFLVDNLLRKYSKVLRSLFSKYSNILTASKKVKTFEQIQQKTVTIHISEILKLLHEYEIEFTSEETQALARQVCNQILHIRNEFKEIDYHGYQQFIIQLAVILNNRIAQVHTSTPQCLQLLINHLRTITASRNQSTNLFDDPESQYFSESDIIKEFNQRLLIDPSYVLPDGYKKITTQEAIFSYELQVLPDEDRIAYEIVSELLHDALGIDLVEPISVRHTVHKAKPNTFGYIQSKLQLEPKDDLYQIKQKPIREIVSAIQPKKKVLEIEPKRELTLEMKLAVAECHIKDRAIAEQVANLLDDMIYATEHNRPTIVRSTQITNKALNNRRESERYAEDQARDKEFKRKERERLLKDRLKEQKAGHLSKIQEVEQDKLQKYQTENLKKIKTEEKRSQYLTDLKTKIRDRSEQQKEEQLRKLLEDKQQNQQQIKLKKEQFKNFNNRQLQKLKSLHEGQVKSKNAKDNKLQEESKKAELLHQQARKLIQTVGQSRVVLEKEVQKEILKKFNSQPFQNLLQKHSVGLSQLFQFLVKETFYPIGIPASLDQITFKTFVWFSDRFNICPEVLNKDEITLIYRQITKDKQQIDAVPIGVNHDEFLQCLFRIAMMGSNIFNRVAIRVKEKDGQMNVESIQQIVDEEQGKQQVSGIISQPHSQSPVQALSVIVDSPQKNTSKSPYQKSQREIKQQQVFFQQTNEHTFEAFLLYLDISNDKSQLDMRFRQALEQKKVPTRLRRLNLQEKLGMNNQSGISKTSQ